MKRLEKGHIFKGPNGQGYVLLKDLISGMEWPGSDFFEPFGGSPQPVDGVIMPDWLSEQLYDEGKDQ